MPLSVNEMLQDRAIRHAVFLIRLRQSEANSVLRLYNSAIPDMLRDVESRISALSSPGSHAPSKQRLLRLGQLRDALDEQIRGLNLYTVLRSNLSSVALTEAEIQARILASVVPGDLGISFRQPSVTLLRSMVTSRPFEGQVLSQWVKANESGAVTRAMKSINLGLTRGESVRDISTRVRTALHTSRREAATITRTAVNHVSAQAREITFSENADVVKAVKWVSTLDDRTSLICASLDGQTFAADEGPRPPAHFNCRSTTVPVLASWEELGIPAKQLSAGTRASMNGQVPDTVTYPEWLKAQPAAVQNEVLGPGRAKLFREGRPLDRFVDEQYRPLSLSEIRRREGLAA